MVAHEWGHAYTEYTDGLIYQWQSGALNESYSDVWGETLDLINNRDDEGEGDLAAKRTVGRCSTHTRRGGRAVRQHARPTSATVTRLRPVVGPVIDSTGFTDDVVIGRRPTRRLRRR